MKDYRYTARYDVLGKESNSSDPFKRGTPILETVKRSFSASDDETAMKSAVAYREHIISASSEFYGDNFNSVVMPIVTRLEKIVRD